MPIKLEVSIWYNSNRKILPLFFFIFLFILYPTSFILAKHTRLFACALANDEPSAFMGGSSMGAGLWFSDDTAKTWIQLGWKHVKCYSVDVVNSSNGKIIYQACGNGVLRSTDAGINWKMLTDWRITEVMDIAIDQVDPKNIYIATSEAIWKSMDGGESWFEADTDIPLPRFTSRIKIDLQYHLRIYAATETGIYESVDGAILWKKVKASTVSSRDMIIGAKGIEAWVDDNGGFYMNGTKHKVDGNLDGGLWSIIHRRDRYLLSGANGIFISKGSLLSEDVKNVHSQLIIGPNLLFGSLNGGVWLKNILDDESVVQRSGLDSMQIWRLKAVEIQ